MGIHVRQVYSGESVAPRVAGCVTIYALTKGIIYLTSQLHFDVIFALTATQLLPCKLFTHMITVDNI